MITGHMIKTLRDKHGMTQSDMARQIGVHNSSIGNWENGSGVSPSVRPRVEALLEHLEQLPPPHNVQPAYTRKFGGKNFKPKKIDLAKAVKASLALDAEQQRSKQWNLGSSPSQVVELLKSVNDSNLPADHKTVVTRVLLNTYKA